MDKAEEENRNGGRKSPSEKATIFDVAERAGVSFVSVSRVFNGHPNVSARMKNRVLQAARVVGYQPRLVCRPSLLAVLVDDHTGMNGRCDKYQLCSQMFLEATRRNMRIEVVTLSQLELLTQHSVDGIIEVETPGPLEIPRGDLPNVPLIFTHHRVQDKRWGAITIDYHHEGEMGISVFLKKRHRKIAVLMNDMNHWSTAERKKGIGAALAQTRAPRDTVTYFSLGEHGVVDVCDAIRAGKHTAVLNFSNAHVLELMDHMFNNLKWNIPGDLSVVSLDNTRFCEHYHPRISSITQPLSELAGRAVEELVRLIESPSTPENHLLQSSYHERESCRTLSAKPK